MTPTHRARPGGIAVWLLAAALTLLTLTTVQAAETTPVTLGTQPASFPDVMYSEVMRRDRILSAELAKEGFKLYQQPYSKGGDMLAPLHEGQLDGAFFGDMPTLTAASRGDIVAVGMIKQTFSSLVGNRYLRLQDLKGRRIAYAHGSTAHYTLMQALRTAGLGERDVTLIQMELARMPKALAAGEIDVFSAWEPAPTLALAEVPGASVVYRGLNTSYFVFRRAFAEAHPGVARALTAALARAVNWMTRSPANLNKASLWALAAGAAYSRAPSSLTVDQAAAITQREALSIPGLPTIPKRYLADGDILAKEWAFLQDLGKLPREQDWNTVKARFDTELLRGLIKDHRRWRLNEFDYDDL